MISTKEQVTVRRLEPGEAKSVFPVALAFHEETGLLVDELSKDYWTATWDGLLAYRSGVIVVLEADGKVVGALCAQVGPSPLAPVRQLTEAMWYVQKPWRGHGKKMLPVMEDIAREMECSRISMAHLVDGKARRMSLFYQRAGYHPAEVYYTKELD